MNKITFNEETNNWVRMGLLHRIEDKLLMERICRYFDLAFQYLKYNSVKAEQTATAVFPIIRRIFEKYNESIANIKDFNIEDLILRIDLAFEKLYPELVNIFPNHNKYGLDLEAEFVAQLSDMFQLEYMFKE